MEQKAVIIVESPAKAKKIQDIVGERFRVLASYGHVRDLPPKPGSVIPEQDFHMLWEPIKNSEKHIQSLEGAITAASRLLLATDPDREGEAISWHLVQELKKRGAIGDATKLCRIYFTEVTEKALTDAINNPRMVDQNLVDAYLARRALDYLFGFHLSPILWRKLPGANSAGRVQSATLRIICEREEEIEKFKPEVYWTVENTYRMSNGEQVNANLIQVDGKEVPKRGYESQEEATTLCERILSSSFKVKEVTERDIKRHPAPPYITSTLQQDSNSKLGYGASKTMQIAQQLYEGGFITYMRTDSPLVCTEAIHNIRRTIEDMLDSSYLPASPKVYKSKVKNRQEAHEAIRVTNPELASNTLASRGFDAQAIALYDLIRKRTLASQTESAVLKNINVMFANEDENLLLRATCNKLVFAGHLAFSKEIPEDIESKSFDMMMGLEMGTSVSILSSHSKSHKTHPPARFTEGTLVKTMEELGIGRPSTYAPTIKLLKARGYIKSIRQRLYAIPLGRILTSFLCRYMPNYVDYNFTSRMESEFDTISSGDQDWRDVLTEFWTSFEQDSALLSEIKATEIINNLNENLDDLLSQPSVDSITGKVHKGRECPSCGHPLSIKLSHKGGPFIGCSQYPNCSYSRSIPAADEHIPTSEEDIGHAYKSMNVAEKYGMRGSVRLLGIDPEADKEIFVRQGPYGPYIQSGTDRDLNMKRVPLPKVRLSALSNFDSRINCKCGVNFCRMLNHGH